jgi:hypothetical protein
MEMQLHAFQTSVVGEVERRTTYCGHTTLEKGLAVNRKLEKLEKGLTVNRKLEKFLEQPGYGGKGGLSGGRLHSSQILVTLF